MGQVVNKRFQNGAALPAVRGEFDCWRLQVLSDKETSDGLMRKLFGDPINHTVGTSLQQQTCRIFVPLHREHTYCGRASSCATALGTCPVSSFKHFFSSSTAATESSICLAAASLAGFNTSEWVSEGLRDCMQAA